MGEQTSPAKNQKVSSMNGVYGCEFLQPTIASLTDGRAEAAVKSAKTITGQHYNEQIPGH